MIAVSGFGQQGTNMRHQMLWTEWLGLGGLCLLILATISMGGISSAVANSDSTPLHPLIVATSTYVPTLPPTTTLFVTNVDDTGDDGVCDNDCSLREAISLAPSGAFIRFADGLAGVIYLSSEITITKTLTIIGPGADLITLHGSNAHRIFSIADRNTSVTLEGLTFSNGYMNDGGGAIYSTSSLIIRNSKFLTNTAIQGGAIYSTGSLTISNSSFVGNQTAYNPVANNFGGAIAGGSVDVSYSVFDNNHAASSGGAIQATYLKLAYSTLKNNHANTVGGAVSIGINGSYGGALLIERSTFATNSAMYGGGAISATLLYSFDNTVSNTTFYGNQGSAAGAIEASGGTITLTNASIVNNIGSVNGPASLAGPFILRNTFLLSALRANCPASSGYIQDGGNNLQYPGTSCGANIPVADPMVGTLGDYGGVTQTLPLLAGSRAIDAGNNAYCAALPVAGRDQRNFVRIVDGNGDGTAVCDIGAFELNGALATPLPSFTPSPTFTPSQTFTLSPTFTLNPSLTISATNTQTSTVVSSTPSKSRTPRPTSTYTLTPTVTLSPTPTLTPSITLTLTPSSTSTFYPCVQMPIIRVTLRRDGAQGTDFLTSISGMSADGRFITFASKDAFVFDDTNGFSDVFLYDRLTCQIERLSVGVGGIQGNGDSSGGSISYDGRYVVFASNASNLVSGDTNTFRDVFLLDRNTQQLSRISVGPSGVQGDNVSFGGVIAGNGRYIAIQSRAKNLTTPIIAPYGSDSNVFLFDNITQTMTLVSVTQWTGHSSQNPAISADGQFVAFQSTIAHLLDDTNTRNDIYLWERGTGQLNRISVADDGSQGRFHSYNPSISADGRYIAFLSDNDFTFDAGTSFTNVYVRDRLTNHTRRASISTVGSDIYDVSIGGISADGRYVVFATNARMIAEEPNAYPYNSDTFVKDMQTGYLYFISRRPDGVMGNTDSYAGMISADNQYIAFVSRATNFVPGDTNEQLDIYLVNMLAVNPATLTPSPTFTPSSTFTPSQTQTASLTPTTSLTPTASETPTATSTRTPSATPTSSLTPSLTLSPTITPTPSSTHSPETLVITTLIDFYDGVCDSQCSLRDAVAKAQPRDTITFAAGLSGNLVLSQPVIVAGKSFTLQGPGSSVVTIDGNYFTHLFVIYSSSTIEMRDLTFAHGANTSGGAIVNNGNLTLRNMVLSDNVSSGDGSAIQNNGPLTIDGSTIKNNVVTGDGGGAVSSTYDYGVLQITNSTFDGNLARRGGALYVTSDATLQHVTFRNNRADDMGGAIYVGSGTFTLTQSEIANNTAQRGGGIALSPIPYSPTRRIIKISDSTIRDNVGGGIFADIQGIETTTIRGSTFLNNGSYGVFTQRDLIVSNSTFYESIGIHGTAGINTLSLWNVTISASTKAIETSSTIYTSQSILVNRTGGTVCTGTALMDGGHNLQYPGVSCGASITNADPLLNLPANNGGPTFTMSLKAGSPALDTADNAVCAVAPIYNLDQRGFTRPTDGDGNGIAICDIGGYEAAEVTLTNTPSVTYSPTASQTPSGTPTASSTPSRTLTPTATAIPLRQDTIGIFRLSDTTFYLRNSNTTGFADTTLTFGASTDFPIAGDWNGDGIDTVGIYRPLTGQFFLTDSTSNPALLNYSFALGIPNDQPIVGDWDGDGKDGVGVFRPSNGLIYLKNSLTTGFADFTMVLGIPGDVGIAGDWNGDGKDSPGVYRPSNQVFYLTNSICNCAVFADAQLGLGIAGDKPFVGDWDADGKSGVGVYRQSNGLTYIKNALTTGFADSSFVFGSANDYPLAGYWVRVTPPPAPSFQPAP